MRKTIAPLALVALLLALVAGSAEAQTSEVVPQPPRWDRETLEIFSKLPVQDDGRVKPLSTYANFALMRLNGKRVFYDATKEELTPQEWLLNVLLYPETARQYKNFLVRDSAVMDAIGVNHEGKERSDRYSYTEIEPGIEALYRLANDYSAKEAKDRTSLEQQIVNLAMNVSEFERLIHFLEFARHDFPVEASPALTQVLPAAKSGEFAAILAKVPTLSGLYTMLTSSAQVEDIDQATREQETHRLEHLLTDVIQHGRYADALALFPPKDTSKDVTEWRTPNTIVESVFTANNADAKDVALIGALEKLAAVRDNPGKVKAQLAELSQQTVALASARAEYSKVPLEYFYYSGNRTVLLGLSVLYLVGLVLLGYLWWRPGTKWAIALATVAFTVPTVFLGNLFYYSLVLYIFSFLLVAVLWFWPRAKALSSTLSVAIAVPTLLVVTGITLRCIIRHRPPVSTLYETILFITAVVVIVSLIIEYMNRQKLALSMASILGVMGLFLANKYELKEGIDTMPTLVAVLDTNFWLATHVVTVTMGYAAGLLAGAIAHVYILGKVFGLKKGDPAFYKTVTRMTYGVLCFGLFFATLGTVLGGIWANDSWGRFWGWDPKENGALMIVLWLLAVLHARMGGYIRDLGVAICSVLGGMVVAFSWWGVNLLGVGLHSYGFTSGIFQTLMIFYAVELVVALMGVTVWLRQEVFSPKAAEEAPAPVAPPPARRKPKRA